MFRFALSARKFIESHLCVLVSLLLALPVLASAQDYLSVFRSKAPDLVELSRLKASCCGAKPDTSVFSSLSVPEYETYKLTATYYSLRDDLTTTLMLNNKGSEPILALPTFYNLSGTRLQLSPITVEAASYLDVDMHQLLAHAGDEFREGSVNIAYQGGNQQLGAQVKMVDAERNLIWTEQLVYGSKFISSRLEGVWWLPFNETKTRVVVSNTSAVNLTATIMVEGTEPRQVAPANIALAPWETRVLDIMNDLVGHPNGVVKSKGGISILHTGSPGAVLARIFLDEANRGYSAAASFIDPETTASQRWHGSGLRLKNLDGTSLEQVIAVRNTGDTPSRIQGKLIYTTPDGSTIAVNFLPTFVAPGATRILNLRKVSKNANIPNVVAYGGIELEYDTPKGSIITSVQSISPSGDHVFQVPMFDPQNMPSSAGGFPWKADGDYTTVVYIKNETAVARKFVSHLIYKSGQYSTGIRDVDPGETVGIDFREFRGNQTPDSQGNVIPFNLTSGQIAWSVIGPENKVLSGRSEQISLTSGIANTYACANCCPNVIDEVFVNPFSVSTGVGLATQFTTTTTERNCYDMQFGPYAASANEWNSFSPSVATVDFSGNSDAVGVGDTNIEGCVERTIWYNWGGGYCEPFTDLICNNSPMEVDASVANIQYKGPNNSTFTDATSTLYVLKDTQVTFKAIPNPVTATFPSGKPTWSGTSSATGTGETVSVTFSTVSSSTSDFKTVIATSENSVTVNVIVYDIDLVFTPAINFASRSLTHFGIEEELDLSFMATPAVTVEQIGGLRWGFVTTGNVGQLTNVTEVGTADYRAPDAANSITFKLIVINGPSKDLGISQGIVSVEPSGGFITKLSGPKHTANTWSTGFKGVIHITPSNVSFFNLSFQEGSCPIVLSGWLNTNEFNIPHAQGPMNRITSANEVDFEDNIFTGVKSPPYGTGTWHWDIPWKIVTNSNRSIPIGTFRQLATADNNGKAVITKGGRSQESNAADPTSDW